MYILIYSSLVKRNGAFLWATLSAMAPDLGGLPIPAGACIEFLFEALVLDLGSIYAAGMRVFF